MIAKTAEVERFDLSGVRSCDTESASGAVPTAFDVLIVAEQPVLSQR